MTNKMPVIIAASTNGKGIGYAKMEIVDSLNPPPAADFYPYVRPLLMG